MFQMETRAPALQRGEIQNLTLDAHRHALKRQRDARVDQGDGMPRAETGTEQEQRRQSQATGQQHR